MPITKLTAGSIYNFTTTSGSTNSIAFTNGTETIFNYVFRNGIVTGISNITSASNTAYNIINFTSIDNSAELYNRGTYRYNYQPIDSNNTSSYDISNSNTNKSTLVSYGSLIVVEGSGSIDIQIPHTAAQLDGTCIKVVRSDISNNNDLKIRTTANTGNLIFKGNINTLEYSGVFLVSTASYASIELLSLGDSWLVTSYTGPWLFVQSS